MKYIILAAALTTLQLPALSQESKSETPSAKVTVQIIEEKGGERVIEERSYNVEPLTSERQRIYLDSLLNSLETGQKNRRVTVTIEDGGLKNEISRKTVKKGIAVTPGKPAQFYHNDWHADWPEFDRLGKEIDSAVSRETAKVEVKVNKLMADIDSRHGDFGFALSNRLDKMKAFNFDNGFSNSSKTIRNASVSPNRPYDGNLNVRFTTREKGDVTIIVTDTKGKEQGKKELKNFEGDFVGQLKVKDAAKGVLFVNIVQNEDGVSQRVSLPQKAE